MHRIIELDKHLFKLINYQWQNQFFDFLMPWLRNAEMWTPLYLFLILLMVINFRETGWWWILFFLLTVIVANSITSDLMKRYIPRLRPCNNPEFAGWIRVLAGYRPGGYGFVSSHAANHFGMAVYIFFTLKNVIGKWVFLFLFWALAISFAQVYVGVHYPLDVTGGMLIGSALGYVSAKIFNKNFGMGLQVTAIQN